MKNALKDKLIKWWFYTKCIWRDEPVRTWRKSYGLYICDGDCGVYSPHGVCTCGLNHYFKITCNSYQKIDRSDVSWRREGHTEEVMRDIPRIEHCKHGLHLDDDWYEILLQRNQRRSYKIDKRIK